MNLKLLLIAATLSTAIISCQQGGNSSNNNGGTTEAPKAAQSSEPLGPVDDSSRLKFGAGGFMTNPEQLLAGVWTSQCFPRNRQMHMPYPVSLGYFRMYYSFHNNKVEHRVREFEDSLCENESDGPININVRDAVIISGVSTVTGLNRTFPNIIQIEFTWKYCTGVCNYPIDPVNGVYFRKTSYAAFRQTMDGRTVLFWGERIPNFSSLPDFDEGTPFFRLQF